MNQTSNETVLSSSIPLCIKIPIAIGSLTAGLYIMGHIIIYLLRKQVLNLITQYAEEMEKHLSMPVGSIISCVFIAGFTAYFIYLLAKEKKQEVGQGEIKNALIILIVSFLLGSILNYPLNHIEFYLIATINGTDAVVARSCMTTALGMLTPFILTSQMLFLTGLGIWYGFIKRQQD